jgi:ComEC/Rec2-related protein
MARDMFSSNERALDLRGLMLGALALAWLAGSVLASFFFASSFQSPYLPFVGWVLLVGAGIALLFIWLLRRDRQGMLIMLLLLCALLGAWRYAIALPGQDPQAISAFIGNSQLSIRGQVVDEPELQGWGSSRVFIVAASTVSRDGGTNWLAAHGQLEVVTRGTTIDDPYGANYGDQVELTGKVQPPTPSTPVGVFASMALPLISVQSGDNSLLARLYHLRVSLATLLAQLLPQPEAALLIAILLGLRTPELKPYATYFNVTGTAHLIASSGFKVTILAGLVANSMQWLQRMPGRQNQPRGPDSLTVGPQRDWRAWLSTLVVLLCIACYTILSGAGAAAIRAGMMGALIVIAPRLRRTYHVYNALALTAMLMSIVNPFVIWDVGFQLSFLGTLGLVRLTPYVQHWFAFIERLPFGQVISENIAVALAAQVATLPIVDLTFQNISLIGPLTNVLTVPLLEILIFLGVCICLTGFIFVPLATLCAWVVWPLLWYVIHVISWCAQVPYAYFIVSDNSVVVWGYYVVLVPISQWYISRIGVIPTIEIPALISPRLWRIGQVGAACVIILAMGANMFITLHSSGSLIVTFLPVGLAKTQQPEGEAILIRSADNRTILIDGGLDAVSLSEQLDSRLPPWQRSLDLVVLTSPRSDHITGLLDIIQRYQVGEVIDAGMQHPDTTYALWRRNINERKLKYLQVAQGKTIPISNISLQILWPLSQLHKGSSEVFDNSMVIRLVLPGLHILLLGAAAQSSYALLGLITELDADYLRAEVVQIAGETSKAVPAELGTVLQQAHARYLIVTPAALSSRQRKSGQPSSPALPALVAGGTWRTIATARVGTVEIVCNQHSWTFNNST